MPVLVCGPLNLADLVPFASVPTMHQLLDELTIAMFFSI
jgi:hypothetical protein